MRLNIWSPACGIAVSDIAVRCKAKGTMLEGYVYPRTDWAFHVLICLGRQKLPHAFAAVDPVSLDAMPSAMMTYAISNQDQNKYFNIGCCDNRKVN